MIELIASGEIESRGTGSGIDCRDGHDPVCGSVSVTTRREVSVDVEFPQGHVNLEGYAPSAGDRIAREAIGHWVEQSVDVADFEMVGSTWDVRLDGNWWDWVQQAHRYVVERPDLSLLGALNRFMQWDETDSRALDTAATKVPTERVTATEVGDLPDDEWDELRTVLNGLGNVQIPESYAE